MLHLSNVTLITIDGVNPEDALKATLHCMKNIRFGQVKLLSYREPACFDYYKHIIEYNRIEKLTYREYNSFKIKRLSNYIDTDFCLIIEPDGLVLNFDKWDNHFFSYDYIGAPWPKSEFGNWPYLDETNRVGNGGFCLRSKKLLEISKLIPIENSDSLGEDVLICRKHQQLFTDNSIQFAPVDVAMKFAVEIPVEEFDESLKTFGFHRYFDYRNMLSIIDITNPGSIKTY